MLPQSPRASRRLAAAMSVRYARFSAMATHYLFEAEFCNPAADWEKGKVEKNVQDARHRLWATVPHVSSLKAPNDWLEGRWKGLGIRSPWH